MPYYAVEWLNDHIFTQSQKSARQEYVDRCTRPHYQRIVLQVHVVHSGP